MISIKTTLAATALAAAGFAVAAPAAQAAVAPHQASAACNAATAAATKASAALDAAKADLAKQIKAGGHPGTAELDNIAALQNAESLSTSDAVRACGGGTGPVGPVRTGVGSTSQGTDAIEMAAGVALLGAVGYGAVAMRRRQAGNQA